MTGFGYDLERHLAALRRYARALRRDRVDADDLVQDALTRALSRAGQFRHGTNLRAWLFAIMHSIHVNQVRQRGARPDELPVDDVAARLVSPARQEAHIELDEMRTALAELPEEQRQVLLLVAVEGMKYEEVARVAGIPVGTVMSRLSRAREALRQRLQMPDRAALRRAR